MTDTQLHLLKAIKANHKDRTPLLVYADYLEGDLGDTASVATAELIRLCQKTKRETGIPLPLARDEWLVANWKRLIPSVMKLHVEQLEPLGIGDAVEGANEVYTYTDKRGMMLSTGVTLPGNTRAGTKLYTCRLELHFALGMVWAFQMKSAFGLERVKPSLERDQPQLFLKPDEEAK